jgi:type IV secretion system protein VirB4
MTTATASNLRREAHRAGALHELLSPCAFFVDAVLTKRGDLFTLLQLSAIDPECLEAEAVDGICRRFEAALRTLGPQYRVYQYLFKTANPELSLSGRSEALSDSRARWLEQRRSELYSVELFLVVMRMRPVEQRTAASLCARFSVRKTLELSRSALRREADALATAVDSLVVQLDGLLRPRRLDSTGTLRFLRRLVNVTPARAEVHGSVQDFHLDQQMAASSLECWPRHLKQDDAFIRLLSLTEPPAQTFPHLLRGLLTVPCNLIVCSEWKREPNGTARREIDKRRRHYHLAKSSMLSYLGNPSPRPDEVLIDDSKTAVVDELNQALREMEVNENHFGRFALTIALYEESEAALRQAVAKTAEIFATHDARLVEESYNMLNAWASVVPGNYAHSLRQIWLLNTSWADLSFLFAPAEGERYNAHLDRPPLAIVETQDGTPYYLNLHVQDVAHTCVLGSIGSGKSFLVNFLAASYQQYGPYTVIFDLGGSYRNLTRHYGGGYLHAGKQNALTINPFCLAPTAENLDFLFSFVRVLIEHGGAPMTPEERKDLHRAIADLYALDPEVRTLATLAQTCRRSYSRRLDEWVGGGRLSGYFDHAEDTLSFRRFQTFDFEGMDKPEVLEPLLFYILHRANSTIYDPVQHQTPKLVVFDEAWRFFRNPVTRAYIHEALKTWRKRNAAMILATQSGDDLLRSELLPTVAESCMTRIFLANPGMDAAAYREAFNLNSVEAALIGRLIPKQQFLLKRSDGAKVLNLFVDPDSFRVFSNTAGGNTQ